MVVNLLHTNVLLLLKTGSRKVCLDSLDINVCNLSLITIEDLGDLLKSRALGLNVEDADEDELEEDPACVDGVELPGGLEVVEAVRVDVLVDGEGNLDEEIHDHETLGANLEGQDFDSVCDEKTRPGERVGDGEDPDHGNDGLASCLAAMSLLLRRADCPDDEGQAHRSRGGDEEWAATNAIDEQSARDGNDKRKNGEATIKAELGIAVSNANALVHIGSVVGDETVARPLREKSERCEEHKTIPVALGLEEVEVRRVLAVQEFKAKCLLDLSEFELNGRVVNVAICVVLAKHLECLLFPVLGDQPTWRFRDEEDESQLND